MSTETNTHPDDPVRSMLAGDRREFLKLTSSGVSALALSSLLNKGCLLYTSDAADDP